MLVWVIVDGEYGLHGPFADISLLVRYIEQNPIVEPVTILQAANGDPRPIAIVVHDALAARAASVMEAAVRWQKT